MDLERILQIITALGAIPGVPKGELIAALSKVTVDFIGKEKARTGLSIEELFEDNDLGLTALEAELLADLAKGE
jgi:hypothetical protein